MNKDSYQHFWEYDPETHARLDDSMSAILRGFLPKNLRKVYEKNSIDGCVAVQADQTLEETDFLLELTAERFYTGRGRLSRSAFAKPEKVLEKYREKRK